MKRRLKTSDCNSRSLFLRKAPTKNTGDFSLKTLIADQILRLIEIQFLKAAKLGIENRGKFLIPVDYREARFRLAKQRKRIQDAFYLHLSSSEVCKSFRRLWLFLHPPPRCQVPGKRVIINQ